MIFSSTLFLVYFLPIFLLLYQIVDRRYKNWCILLASILFYAWGAPRFIFILLASTIIDFYLVRALYQAENTRKKKRWLLLSLVMNVGLLLYFKYANFFVENANATLQSLGMESVTWTSVALPIGISFYTFQTLTYSIDVYRKVRPPLQKLSDYLLYILSFPQMIAGPIVRFNSIAAQIESREETLDDKLQGFVRFCIGLGKKVLIANIMGEQADLIFENTEGINTATAWLGILAYTFQIYFDFSGYSDMAIGLGRMMGFRFPENFDSPYTSGSITEFWRRWHITLGEWMRDYLYIPLGGNRVKSKARLYFNLWAVFLISGLWHGAAWSFIFWGAYHGLFLILDRLFLLKILKRIGRIPSLLFTFLVVMIGWVFFRIENISEAFSYVKVLFTPNFAPLELELSPTFYFTFLIAIFFSFATLTTFAKGWERSVFFHDSPSKTWYIGYVLLALLLFLLSLGAITTADFNPFIYFRF